jgi:hypothetical protein
VVKNANLKRKSALGNFERFRSFFSSNIAIVAEPGAASFLYGPTNTVNLKDHFFRTKLLNNALKG